MQFYTCYKFTNSASDFPVCQSPGDGTPLGITVTVTGPSNGNVGTATSIPFSTKKEGVTCFLAVFASTSPAYGGTTDAIVVGGTLDNTAQECFFINSPTAVTVSSMSARVMDDGAGWAMLGLGALGIVTLGAVVFVIARKR